MEAALTQALGVAEPGARVAVVTRPGQAPDLDPLRETGADVTSYDVGDLDDLHLRLTAAGRHALVVDLAGGAGLLGRFRSLLFHLVPGGRLVVALPDRSGPRERLLNHLGELRALRGSEVEPPQRYGDFRPSAERDAAAEAWSLTPLLVDDDVVVVTSEVATLAKIPEASTNALLDRRPDLGRVLDRLPAQTFVGRGRVRTGPRDVPLPAPDRFEVPELSLREVDDAVFWTRQAATVDGVVLPASFRHPTRNRLLNKELRDWSARFVLAADEPARRLGGRWFLFDNFARGHFGHALTEQVALLWGWQRAKQQDPSLRALVSRVEGHDLAAWELELFEAGGLSRTDLHLVDEPMRVEQLVTATPMFALPDYVHPELAETYDRVGAALAAGAIQRDWPRRLFSARSNTRRTCHNAAELESWFTDAGFEVVRPEEHALADQVAMFRAAEVVAGYSGSNLFQTAFTGGPRHVITIAPESYLALNEHLIGSVVGHRLDRVYCRPDVPHGERWSEAAYHSDYTFDPDREGVFLREVLTGLTR